MAALPPGVVGVGPVSILSITTAPDGTVYAGGIDAIWRITDSGVIAVYSATGLFDAVTAAPDGSLLFSNPTFGGLYRFAAGRVTTIDPRTAVYRGVLATADGAVWYGPAYGGLNGLVRVGPGGQSTTFFASTTFGPVVAGANNAVWAFELNTRRVHRVTPEGTFMTVDLGGHCCGNLGTASDGAGGVWFSETGGGGPIRHLDAGGVLLPDLVVPGLETLSSLYTAPDGTLYVGAKNAIFRVQAGSAAKVAFEGPPALYASCNDGSLRGYQFGPFTHGEDGSVWVAQQASSGYGFGSFSCPSSPPELYSVIHVSSTAFPRRRSRAIR